MPDSTPIRRSDRQRVPNRKFVETENAFQLMSEILAEDDTEDEQQETFQREVVAEEDLDFAAELASQGQDWDATDSDPAVNFSDGSEILTPVEESEFTLADAIDEPEKCQRYPPERRKQSTATDHDVRSRGLTEYQLKGREDRITLLAGRDEGERSDLLESKVQWGRDPCLPRRENMQFAFAHPEEVRDVEAGQGWKWYDEQGGQQEFAERQGVSTLDAEAGAKYVAGRTQDVFLGPYGTQKHFQLPHLQSLPLDLVQDEFGSSTEIEVAAGLDQNLQSSRKRRRHGWTLNIGARLQCLDWAPNQNGHVQYLALAPSQNSDFRAKALPKTSPAFTPAASTPSNIQIWAFDTNDNSETRLSRGNDPTPELKQVLCSEWGDAKQLKWCPIPRRTNDREDPDNHSLGLLASIWSDGYARILDIHLNISPHNRTTTTYRKLETSPFAARLEDTICTYLCWLSPTDIAIGHANGSISLYDIYPPSSSPNQTTTTTTTTTTTNLPTAAAATSSQPSPQPYLTIPPPHPASPVLTLTSAYPTHPTVLATTCIAGHDRIFDLRAPLTDCVYGQRTRSPASNLTYHPHLLSFVYNEEGHGLVRASGLRCWGVDCVRIGMIGLRDGIGCGSGSGSGSGRQGKNRSGMGMALGGPLGRGCLDVGKVHGCVAWGEADGSVVVCNPMRAALGTKRDGAFAWQVCVFRLEWARRRSRPSQVSSASLHDGIEGGIEVVVGDGNTHASSSEIVDVEMQEDSDPNVGELKGTSRITDSYKAEKVHFKSARSEKPTLATIYEEENGVTAVCWNPNLKCGGWLAAGWGCGLVRVEDVAI